MFLIPSATKTTSRNQTNQPSKQKKTKPAINTLKTQRHDLFDIYVRVWSEFSQGHDRLLSKAVMPGSVWKDAVHYRLTGTEPVRLVNGADVQIDEDLLSLWPMALLHNLGNLKVPCNFLRSQARWTSKGTCQPSCSTVTTTSLFSGEMIKQQKIFQ